MLGFRGIILGFRGIIFVHVSKDTCTYIMPLKQICGWDSNYKFKNVIFTPSRLHQNKSEKNTKFRK